MIQSFRLEDDRYLFFDIFHKNNKLVLVRPVYSNCVDNTPIYIRHNDRELTLLEKYSELQPEPIEIRIYSFCSDERIHSIRVEYKGIHKEYTLEHTKTTMCKTISVSTLFKDDSKLLHVFYDYYRKQGVTNFYLYYNGTISDELRQMCNLPGVTLLEWNFRYWNEHCEIRHHAQIGQIHHAMYRYGKEVNEYMILCDFDEYMYVPGKKLSEYVYENSTIDVFGFHNLWSDTIDGAIPCRIPTTIRVADGLLGWYDRTKCIYKTEVVRTVNIHGGRRFSKQIVQRNNHTMFHFYKWSGLDRRVNTNNTMILENIV